MRPLASPQTVGRLDSETASAGTPVSVLMERAGRAVARAALRTLAGRYGNSATVVCGKGNNGGDGFVAARALAREGVGTRCLSVADLSGLKGPAADYLAELRRAGIRVEDFSEDRLRGDVIVDAIFGTGFHGSAEGPAARAIEAINVQGSSGVAIVAVDIPSGVNGETGAVEGVAVHADVTVAMGFEKFGTALSPGAKYAGHVEVAPIGLLGEDTGESPDDSYVMEESDVFVPARDVLSHKRSNGSVAILAGSDEIRGAALLAAQGALRAGAGYVTLGTSPAVKQAAASRLPELLTTVVANEVLGADALQAFGEVLSRADALAVGPGLGTGGDQEKLMQSILSEVRLPLVIDADGLNVLAGHSAEIRNRVGKSLVITPHPAELGRLLGTDTAEIQMDRLSAARRAAAEFSCTVLLKGYRTVVADETGTALVIPVGGPELASAGTGDVLTGALAAFLAAGAAPTWAAASAAYLHGLAGQRAAYDRGAVGVLAGDVAEALPLALRRLLSR